MNARTLQTYLKQAEATQERNQALAWVQQADKTLAQAYKLIIDTGISRTKAGEEVLTKIARVIGQ